MKKRTVFPVNLLFCWLNNLVFFVPHTRWFQVIELLLLFSKPVLVCQWYSNSWHLGLNEKQNRYKFLVKRDYHFPVSWCYVLGCFIILLAILPIATHLKFSIEWVFTIFFCLWLTLLTERTRRYHTKKWQLNIHLWVIHIRQTIELALKEKIKANSFLRV